jgi:adenosine deaminase CECR1
MGQLWMGVVASLKRRRGSVKDEESRSAGAESKTTRPAETMCAGKMVEAQDAIISSRSGKLVPTALDLADPDPAPPPPLGDPAFADADDYFRQRAEIDRRERTLGFEHACTAKASAKERRAAAILQRLRGRDDAAVYAAAAPRTDPRGQSHARRAGDHFLSNVDLVERTAVFEVARRMPKGAHLHIHFNACLPPDVLLGVAKTMDRMFITSDVPLTAADDYAGFRACELQFSLLRPGDERPGDLFDAGYEARRTMPFRAFLERFPERYPRCGVDEWLRRKLVFSEDEAHDALQTSYGIWDKFNGRTRMMKGLFNYERAYRAYTRLCLEDFARDNIQYAEIRPNFMKTNQLVTDDARGTIDNAGIMEIIISECEAFADGLRRRRERGEEGVPYFAGLKVIYCTPRSFSNENVGFALRECLEFKKRWPKWIAGMFSPSRVENRCTA